MICPSCNYNNIEGMDRCANCMEPLRDLDIPRADAATGIVRSVIEDELRELRPRAAYVVAPDETIAGAVRGMREASARCALVLDGARFAGLFTEHDAVRAMVEGDAEMTRVADVMTRDMMPLRETDSVAHALSQMATGDSRFVPIAHEDGSYAVISAAGVLEYIADEDW